MEDTAYIPNNTVNLGKHRIYTYIFKGHCFFCDCEVAIAFLL